MNHLKKIATMLLIFMASHARCQNKQDSLCASASTTVETEVCLSKTYSKSNNKLNEIYRKILNKLNQTKRIDCVKSLTSSEVKWIAFRDSYANLWAKLYAGGSEMSIMVLESKLTTTNLRITELNALFEEINK